MNSVIVSAPAKLNLTLDITGIEPNGYHTMDMLMQAVNLTERVTLARAADICVTATGARLPMGPSNTAYKAAVLFFQQTGLLAGVHIHIEKKTPIRAGMAGGSADAAAVLVGLNTLYSAGLSLEELCALGAAVGADVPFAICGGTARVGGFGEKITPLPALMDCRFVVVMPGYGISTPEAFANYDQVGTDKRPNNEAAVAALTAGDYDALMPCLANVLEKASNGPDTEAICNALTQAGADAALMTGSGAAVYGIFKTEQAAQSAASQLKKRWQKVWVLAPHAEGTKIEK